ncbi:MAG: glycosyltransferase family 2 protein [Anaerolineae bacterium]|nr:glycosyltransferase family 2 protein [Anaerolineae bacterium]
MAPLVYVSILNWNRPDLTIACLESLAALNYDDYKVLVVDNASRDDSVAQIQTAFPDVEIIRSDTNLGFAAGHRVVKDRALADGAELLWMLNNDATANTETLSALVEAYQRDGDALYGSFSLSEDVPRKITFGGGRDLDANGQPQVSQPYNPLSGKSYDPSLPDRSVTDANGSSFMVPLSLVRQHGFMDEEFFFFGEETDYCYRMRAAGVPVIMVTRSTIIHQRRGSTTGSQRLLVLRRYYKTRSELIMLKRHQPDVYKKEIRRSLKTAIPAWLKYTIWARRDRPESEVYYVTRGVIDAALNRVGKRLDPDDFLD